MIVTSFYKYAKIASPEKFRVIHQALCDKIGIKGKILVAKEGINGSVSGTKKQIGDYKKQLRSGKLFSDITFKDTPALEHPFRKMIVRVRPEIVTFKAEVDMSKKAEYVTAGQLRNWIKKQEVILIDARNNYESKIGRFKGAITPDIDIFSEFPRIASELQHLKDKKIVTYCTGGIRCEKASAFLKQSGFENIYQLKDGILEYIRQFPDGEFEGRCFVFDDRMSVPSGKKSLAIAKCEGCHAPADSYLNCRNARCDKMFVSCTQCEKELEGNCSKLCFKIIPDSVNKA